MAVESKPHAPKVPGGLDSQCLRLDEMPLCSLCLLVICVLFSTACAQSHEGHADLAARSGTRLRLRWMEGEGVSVVLGFHDIQLGAACAVRRAKDGELYCFPGAMQPELYADASCSETATPVARCASTPATQTTVVSWSGELGGGCASSAAELYTVQAPELFEASFLQLDQRCVASSVLLGPQPAFMGQRLGSRVPESALVHVDEVRSPGDGPVQSRYYVGDDGSVLPVGFFDARFGACDPGLAADSQIRCLPRSAIHFGSSIFVDAACSVEAAIVSTGPGCDAATRRLLAKSEPDTSQGACGSYRQRFFELGGPVTSAFAGPSCGALGTSPEQLVHRIGPELDPRTFAPLDVAELGTGRLRMKGWAAPGLEPVFGSTSDVVVWGDAQLTLFDFTDGQLALSCSAAVTADGVLRCAPTASAFAYSDATCTRPVVYQASACAPGSGPALARLENAACMVSVHTVALEAEALAMAFARPASTCLVLGSGAARGYALEEAVDLAMFAQMRERVE